MRQESSRFPEGSIERTIVSYIKTVDRDTDVAISLWEVLSSEGFCKKRPAGKCRLLKKHQSKTMEEKLDTVITLVDHMHFEVCIAIGDDDLTGNMLGTAITPINAFFGTARPEDYYRGKLTSIKEILVEMRGKMVVK